MKKNPKISASIYPKILRPLREIQLEGRVKILKGKENFFGLKVYIKRFKSAEGEDYL